MIQRFVDRFMKNKAVLVEQFGKTHPKNYATIVALVVGNITDELDDRNPEPDPERVHQIDDGNYQGTLLFIIGATGYQPSDYWSVKVDYGSCSGCDTLQAIHDRFGGKKPTSDQVEAYMTLALHIVQGLRALSTEEDV